MDRGSVRLLSLGALALLMLSGCGSFDRASDAAAAKHKMVGMTKEQVLACMGPPKQKAHVDATEVWSYASTNGLSTANGISQKIGKSGATVGTSSHQHYFCTVNVVMTNDVVSVVHYNGPRGGMLAQDEQCGYAVEHCIE